MDRISLRCFSFLSVALLALGALFHNPIEIRRFDFRPLYDLAFLSSYAIAPADEIRLQAALVLPEAATDSATLNADLRAVDIRTALEDTRRLCFDLG